MRKFMMIISVIVLSIFLLSCGDGRLTDFEKVVKSIYDSELEIAGYNEVDIIKDGNLEVYKKEMNFLIQRGKTVRTEVDIVENKLSTSGNSLYDETKISYFTVDNAKYVELNGSTYENEYTMPTYYLTFVLSEDFLEKGYNLEVNDNNYKLSGFSNFNVINMKNKFYTYIINNYMISIYKEN